MALRINLRSDTATRPSPAMRRAIAEAEVGDEQRREDPTTNRLIARIAALLGKDDAVFLPSATMANQIALAVHAEGGDEAIGHRLSHAFNYEAGAPAYLARVAVRLIDGERGMYTPEAVEAAVRAKDYHFSRSRLLLVENTTNLGGGAVWPMDRVRAVTQAARAHGMVCHMDGARLFNAVVASGVSAAEYASHFDSATVCFSKGLGAPVGAALAGSSEFIARAWRFKHLFGGAMRQSGILAAAALYGLDHNIERLAEDHANAKRLAESIASLPGIRLDPATVETNIVVFDVDPKAMMAADLCARMREHEVEFYSYGPHTCRIVTHLDVTAGMIDEAIAAFRRVMKG